MNISKFKATCLAVLADVRKTRVPVRVTRRGEPIADIVPPVAAPKQGWIGCMRDRVEFLDEGTKPIGAFRRWKVQKL